MLGSCKSQSIYVYPFSDENKYNEKEYDTRYKASCLITRTTNKLMVSSRGDESVSDMAVMVLKQYTISEKDLIEMDGIKYSIESLSKIYRGGVLYGYNLALKKYYD